VSSRFTLQQAASVCHQGGVIAYPTESVYGLGCDPLNHRAVQYLLTLKQRSVDKGLILIGSSLTQLLPFIDINQQHIDIMQQASQPITWLIKKSPLTPSWISGKHDKLAVRITRHPLAAALCDSIGHAIVSTSANPGGKPPAKTRLMVQQYFGDSIDFIVPGDVGDLQNPTEIRDLETGKIIRAGS
jgi:L-threonylcarbamoyladenylate synthase